MRKAVAGDLMPRGGDAPDEARVTFRDPPEHEERPADSALGQELEQHAGVALDTRLALRPGATVDGRCQRGHLEVVLDVDCERVDGLALRGALVHAKLVEALETL